VSVLQREKKAPGCVPLSEDLLRPTRCLDREARIATSAVT